jgi:hypothetical protein
MLLGDREGLGQMLLSTPLETEQEIWFSLLVDSDTRCSAETMDRKLARQHWGLSEAQKFESSSNSLFPGTFVNMFP